MHTKSVRWFVFLGILILAVSFAPQSHAMKTTKYEGQTINTTKMLTPIAEQSGLSESVGINDNGSALINGNIIDYNYSTNALLGYFAFYGGSFYS
ncbi:hypothetical protein, partial [Caldisphaera sp.]|uniref:hypothetical protein n=1 Tax=Caldisphaera sp. TaxID=2060322 RepID=UPI003D127F79